MSTFNNYEDLVNAGVEFARAGTAGQLGLGEVFSYARHNGIKDEQLEASLAERGVGISRSRHSFRVATWEKWCRDWNIQPDEQVATDSKTGVPLSLTSVSLDKLYFLRDQLNKREDVPHWLEFAFNHTEAECRAIRGGATEQEVEEVKERRPEFKSLKLPIDLYEQYMTFVDKLRASQRSPNMGHTYTLRFMLGSFDDLSAEQLDYLFRQFTGELTDEEQAELLKLREVEVDIEEEAEEEEDIEIEEEDWEDEDDES